MKEKIVRLGRTWGAGSEANDVVVVESGSRWTVVMEATN